MIRVDGRARFLDCPAVSDEIVTEYVRQLSKDEEHWKTLEHKGATDLSHAMPDGSARGRVNIFHSRQRYAIVMRRSVTKIPNFDELNLPAQVEELANFHRGIVIV